MIAHCLSGDKKKWFLILAKSSVMQAFGKPLPFSLPFSVNGEHLRQNSDGHNIPMHVSLPDRKVTSKSYLGLALRESVRLCMLRTQTQHGCVYAWATPLPCDIKQSQWDIVSWTIMLLLQVLAFACKGSLQVLSRQEQLKVYWYVYLYTYTQGIRLGGILSIMQILHFLPQQNMPTADQDIVPTTLEQIY